MISTAEIIDFLQTTELFQALAREQLEQLAGQFELITLESGDVLIKQGEVGDCLYLVFSGRLRASATTLGSSNIAVLGEMGRGELIGELALLTHETRAATVTAIRDSVILKLAQTSFTAFIEKNPQQMMPIVRSAILRLREGKQRVRNTVITIAVAPAANNKSYKKIARAIAKELTAFAPTLYLDRQEIAKHFATIQDDVNLKLIHWLNYQESEYSYIVYETEEDYTSWTKHCIHQADQVVLIAEDDNTNLLNQIEMEIFSRPKLLRKKVDLVLSHPADLEYPQDTHEWLRIRKVNQFHHVRAENQKDIRRVARILTGRSIGLVLSGGGARGFVHIGVYQALLELGYEIDLFGGASFGGLLACFFAMEVSPETVMELFRKKMLSNKKFFVITAPLVSLNTGENLTEVLKYGFAKPACLEDLWKKYFCVVCNLSRGEMEVQETGTTWKAMRATVSLPAIFPPITNEKNELLIDGGVSNNFPVDIMHQLIHGGKIIASHVQTNSQLHAEIPEGVLSGWRLLLHNLFKHDEHVPNIAEVILRSIGLASYSHEQMMMTQADYYIDIDARKFKLLDFHAMDKLVELGYQTTMEQMVKNKLKI